MVTRYTFEGEFKLDDGRTDGGQSFWGDMSKDDHPLFVRIMSWDESKQHKAIKTLAGRKIKVTIEVLP